jgi:branched-chain amino acid transport system permease protein
MTVQIVNQILQGTLLGGLYALFAVGLSLSLGVIRFINIAHGDLIVLASFLLMSLTAVLGISPFLGAALMMPLAFAAGYSLQRTLLQRVVGPNVLPVILVTFGLAIIIQNGLLETYGPNTRKLFGGEIEVASIRLAGAFDIGLYPLAVFFAAIAVIAGLDAFLYRTPIGARIRAVADDPAGADLIGLSSAQMYAIAMGVVGLTVMLAACCMAVWTNFDPPIGPSRLLTAFEVVVLGGLGSLWGTLVGGIVLGVAQNLGAQIDAGWEILAQHLVFLFLLVLRPRGLFPKA